jgi:hypothetical protein
MSEKSLEQEARMLHAAIYGPQSDRDWDGCKDIWIQQILWLRNNQNRDQEPASGFFVEVNKAR